MYQGPPLWLISIVPQEYSIPREPSLKLPSGTSFKPQLAQPGHVAGTNGQASRRCSKLIPPMYLDIFPPTILFEPVVGIRPIVLRGGSQNITLGGYLPSSGGTKPHDLPTGIILSLGYGDIHALHNTLLNGYPEPGTRTVCCTYPLVRSHHSRYA